MWYIWLIAAGVFFVAEIITVGFLIFWLGIGALLAMITSFITSSLLIQTIVFVFSSTVLILFTKPLVNKYVSKKPTPPTNSYSLINKRGIVIAPIDALKSVGQIKVDGQVWSAKTEDESNLPEGSEVEVLGIDGVKLVVKAIRIPTIN